MAINEQDMRTVALIGEEALSKIKNSRVALFGVGGVGSFCAEALVRAGVGKIDLFDCDEVSVSNINRQIIALHSTVGRKKVEVMKERILDINPECEVATCTEFLTEESVTALDLLSYDYIVDAIDTVSVKLKLAEICYSSGIPIIASMGTGNKLNPTEFRVADIFSTKVCPLARAMRSELKRRGVSKLLTVYSEEVPKSQCAPKGEKADGNPAPASISFVPSTAGLILASEVIRALSNLK